MITITKKDYIRLLQRDEILSRLEIGGVDNWEWYGEAINPEGTESLDSVCSKIKDDVTAQ